MGAAFGELVRSWRTARGLSQRAFAELVDVDFTYISKIETAELAAPSDGVIERMATVLDVSPDLLLNQSAKAPRDWGELLEGNPRLVQILRLLAKTRYSDEEYQAVFELLRDDGFGLSPEPLWEAQRAQDASPDGPITLRRTHPRKPGEPV